MWTLDCVKHDDRSPFMRNEDNTVALVKGFQRHLELLQLSIRQRLVCYEGQLLVRQVGGLMAQFCDLSAHDLQPRLAQEDESKGKEILAALCLRSGGGVHGDQ